MKCFKVAIKVLKTSYLSVPTWLLYFSQLTYLVCQQFYATIGAVAGGAGALLFALDQSVKATDLELHPPKNPWSHKGYFDSLDHAR